MSGIVTRVETITPEIAGRYLECNTRNRPLRPTVVERLVRMMKAGEFMLTHQGIAFDLAGNLLDGQHRLAAIVKAGVTVQMTVSRNVPGSAQLVMDDHARRQHHDTATLWLDVPVGADDAAVLRSCVEYQRNRGNGQDVTRTEFIALWPQLSDGIAFSRFSSVKRSVTIAPVRQAFALAYYYESDLERLTLGKKIVYGDELPGGDGDRAMVTLREGLLSRTGRHATSERVDIARKAQRAVQAFCRSDGLTKLYAPGVWPYPFPFTESRVR